MLYYSHGKPKPGGLPSFYWRGDPLDERKEGDSMYITFADLIQFCLLLVALVSLCYTVFKGKKD